MVLGIINVAHIISPFDFIQGVPYCNIVNFFNGDDCIGSIEFENDAAYSKFYKQLWDLIVTINGKIIIDTNRIDTFTGDWK